MQRIPTVKKILTKGEIIVVATIPPGAKLPKTEREMGAEKLWAPQDVDNPDAIVGGSLW